MTYSLLGMNSKLNTQEVTFVFLLNTHNLQSEMTIAYISLYMRYLKDYAYIFSETR